MDDVNDADQEDEIGGSEPECGTMSKSFIKTIDFPQSETANSEYGIENSLIGSRVPLIPKSNSEAEALEALLVPELFEAKSVSHGFHYFSDGESGSRGGHSKLDPPSSYHDRPSTPGILSDSELDNQTGCEDQNVWRWGEVPNTSPSPVILGEDGKSSNVKESTTETKERSWFSGWSSK